MIEQALSYLSKMAVNAADPKRLEVADPRANYFWIEGESVKQAIPKPPRQHEPETLDDLIALANRFTTDENTPAVWYSDAAVVLVIDDAGHRVEQAAMALEHSDVFTRLGQLKSQKTWFEQKDFVRLLRIDLAGTLDPLHLLNKVRKIKFENGSTVSRVVGKQTESLGREITSRAETEGGDLPEEVTLSVPVYKTPGETARYGLRCSVEVEPMNGTFRLLPLPDEIERVQQLAVGSIGERLLNQLDSAPCYQGQP